MKAVFMPNRADDGMLRITSDLPQLDWTVALTAAERAAALTDAEILVLAEGVCCAELGALLVTAPRLRWIQFSTAGNDQCIRFGLPAHIPITGGGGIKAPTVAEHAFAMLLSLARKLRELEAERLQRRWSRAQMFSKIATLEDATLVIVGFGHVGQDLAKKAKAFGMRVVVVSRAAQPGPNVDMAFPRRRLAEALALADAVVVCTQISPETEDLIGEAELDALRPSAVIVNVARGEMIDEAALVKWLKQGRLAGAALDVMREEPLPADHEFWDMENVLLTPHVAGAGGDIVGYGRFAARFSENLRRLQAGEPLLFQITIAPAAPRSA